MRQVLLFVAALLLLAASAPIHAQSCDNCHQYYSYDVATNLHSMLAVCVGVMPGNDGWTGCTVQTMPACGHLRPDNPQIDGIYQHCHFATTHANCTSYEPPDPDGGENPPGCPTSPVVVKLGNGPWKFGGPDDAVTFDLLGYGDAERWTWTKADSAIAFLVIDRNGDGIVNGSSEMFTDYAPTMAERASTNGYIQLGMENLNGDTALDANDPVWNRLKLWTDRNHDAVSQASELQSVADAGIASISIVFSEASRADRFGNEFRYKSQLTMEDGKKLKTFDVYLRKVE